MPTIKRSIHFYQALHKFTDAPLTNAEMLALWSQLEHACRTTSGAYVDLGNDEVCRPWVDDYHALPLRLRFGKTRKSGLPQIEGQGQFRPIAINSAIGEGVNDLSHIVGFRNAVIGHEFNWYAPRLGTLAFYIAEKTGMTVKFVPLLNSSAAERLDQLSELYSFKLKVKSDYLDELRTAHRPLKDAIDNLKEFGGGHDIEIEIKADRRSEGTLAQRTVEAAKRILSRSDRDGLKKLTVSGLNSDTNKIDEIDLLREFLVSKQDVVTTNRLLRTVNSDSAYTAIDSAHRDLAEEIRVAIGGQS